MSITKKFQEIISLQKSHDEESPGILNPPISNSDIEEIEKLLEEKLPSEILELYCFANGQNDIGNGVLFGHSFCNSEEIIRQLQFSRSSIKPETNSILNPEQSEHLIEEIIGFYVRYAPRNQLFGLQKSWYKMEFSCSPQSSEGPYLYLKENTTDRNREILDIDIDELRKVLEMVKNLQELERESYHWDELKCIVYSNGKYEVERSSYDFDHQIPFTSTPENAIQKKYFHYKWLPVFSDSGGNYIGIDLDPDINGTKGQIINFGRDEEDMFVLAENLEQLFDKLLVEATKHENRLVDSETHLHDIVIEMIKEEHSKTKL
ncbi:SMI1/KNR4 family protein [Chryseobacterium luteum]|uniref:SMI1/KNR4 family protein n=1 Tax=Chryseobacterium luteum TaxID=421531 RepID=UPI00068E2597|nr:SMI1/KNR4 family protein [Chryseobacterium luteum]